MVTGLGALGFWIFMAVVVVGGVAYAAREREARHATLRALIEKGQPVDRAHLDRLLAPGGERSLSRHLMIFGLITLFLAIGFAAFALLVALASPAWLWPLLGVAALSGFAAIGLMAAAGYLGDEETRKDAPPEDPDA